MKNTFLILALFCLFSCGKKQEKSEYSSRQVNNDIMELSAREQVLINLKIDTVRTKAINETITLLGKATVDENKIKVISSRVEGRLDKLYARNTGEEIKAGQALYSVYSEELLSDENEYLLALRQKPEFSSQKNMVNELVGASRQKLLLWGLTEKQIAELEKNQIASPLITFFSNVNGYLAELNISEGEYVETGTPLFKIAQSNSVWVEAQFYPYEIKYLNKNSDLTVRFDAIPDDVFKGKIVFESPAFEQNSRISYVRIEVQNKDGKIKPGMMTSVFLKTNQKRALVIPKSAITLEEMPTVWIEKEKRKYEMRMVHIGIQTKTEVEILHGLNEGEKIVSYGAYLINSAYILKHGAGSMAGMQM